MKLNWLKGLKKNISMKNVNKNMTSFAEHLDQQYGERGTEAREQYEQGFEAFKLGVMIQEMRKEEGQNWHKDAKQRQSIYRELKTMR